MKPLRHIQYNDPYRGLQNYNLYQKFTPALALPLFTLYSYSIALLLHYFYLHTGTLQITFRIRKEEVKGHCPKQAVISECLLLWQPE